jgi:GAF domain-containing protein
VTPMEPIPETSEVLDELDPVIESGVLLDHLTNRANRGQEIIPDLVGVSIAGFDHGLTFTLIATTAEIAVLDAVQYLAGGPCVAGAHENRVREFPGDDVLDEERWRLFAEATAARAVRSTLTLPVVTDGIVTGTVNLYAGSPAAFVGHHDELAEVFGAWAAGAVANTDLSFTTRRQAQAAPELVRESVVIEAAIGLVAAQQGVGVDAAEDRLRSAATRAGVSLAHLAGNIVHRRERLDGGER